MLRKLVLAVSFVSIAFVLMGSDSCWLSSQTVDNSANVGLFTSVKISNVPSWTVPSRFAEASGSGYPNGLTIDSSGNLYSVHNENNSIYLATKTPMGTWSDICISSGNQPDWFDAVIDGNGYVQISYVDLGLGQIHYISNLTGSYTDQTVNTSLNPAFYSSIAVDQSNNPHIVFYDGTNNVLRHTTTVAAIWTLENVGAGVSALWSSMVMDNQNQIHVAAIDTTDKLILYFKKSGSTWTTQTAASIDTINTILPGISIAVASDGTPYIAYYGMDSTLRFATRSGSTWTSQTVDTIGDPGDWGCCIRLDSSGTPHIVYNRFTQGTLCYATKSGGGWTTEVLNRGPIYSSLWTNLEIGTTGNPEIVVSNEQGTQGYDYITKSKNVEYIAYYDVTDQALKHATGIYGNWGTEFVDTTGDSGYHSSIDLDTSGYPYILYGRLTGGMLQFAARTTGTWSIESVRAVGFSGNPYYDGGKLAIGSNNIPQIAYFNDNDYTLYYGAKSTNSWFTQSIDTLEFAGQYPSLALDQNNLPHIAYMRTTTAGNTYNPSYIHYNGSTWIREDVDSLTTDNGYATSIAIDNQGNPHIAYNNIAFSSLKYASKIGGIWTTENVDTIDSDGYFNSLQIDEYGNPHITYYTNDNSLYYARLVNERPSHKWYIENITGSGNGGQYDSLALQQGYVPSVSYYYGTGTSLNFVQRDPSFYTLPDIKVLLGQSISSAFNLNDYALFAVSSGNWNYGTYDDDPLINNLTLNGNGVVTYTQTTINSFGGDTVYYYDFSRYTSDPNVPLPTYWSQYKQSSFLLSKLPRAIAEGKNILENSSINLVNYLSQSTTYSGSTFWQVSVSAVSSSDTTSISTPLVSPSGNLNLGLLSAPISDQVDFTVRVSSDIGGTDWDKEIIRMYPVLNTHSEFSTASETTQWAYQLPPNITTYPTVSWTPGPGGTGGGFGSMYINFTAQNEGIKLTPLRSNWVPTIPNQWYIARILLQADTVTPVSNNVVVSAFAFNGDLSDTTNVVADIGADVTASISTAWTWYEIPIYSNGTSMYCQIQLKNTTTTPAKVRINKYEIIKAEPATVLEYGTAHISGSGETWGSAGDTSRWAFQEAPGASGLASYSVSSGLFDIHFAGDENRGVKMTAQVAPTIVKSYPLIAGKTGGMSLQLTTSGTLNNPFILLAVFGSSSVNNQTFQELGAFANVFHVVSNDQNIIRMAYPATQPNGYMQMQFKNAGDADFYITNIYQEADQDTNNYWDNGLFP